MRAFTDQTKPTTPHTPGPWVYTLDAKGICGIHQANNATGVPVKIGEAVSNSQKQAEANAALIAAAPDSHEANLDFVAWLDSCKRGWPDEALLDRAAKKARAAIAKATTERRPS